MSREPNRNVYVGHRYVPLILEEWDKKISYEGLSVVTHKGNSYTSKKRVPVGIDILNKEFWSMTGNYNAQVDYYRQETERVAEDLLLKSDQTYVDTELDKKSDKTYVDTELGKKANKTYVDTELGKKADQTYTDTELGKKSDKTYVDTELGKKSNQTYVDTELDKKTDQSYVDTIIKVAPVNTSDISKGINDFYQSLDEGETIKFPSGEYDLYDPLTFDRNINIDFKGVKFNYYGSGYAITIGHENDTIEPGHIILPDLYKNGNINWTMAVDGVRVLNIYNTIVYFGDVEKFRKGIVIDAKNSKGNSYNDYYFKRVVNNLHSLVLTSDLKGWTNENTFNSGRFGMTSDVSDLVTENNTHVLIEYNDYSQNNNVFNNVSFESGVTNDNGHAVIIEDGRMIYFRDCRYEGLKKVKILKGVDIQFTDGFGSENLVFTDNQPRTLKSQFRYNEARLFGFEFHSTQSSTNDIFVFKSATAPRTIIKGDGSIESNGSISFRNELRWGGTLSGTPTSKFTAGSGSPISEVVGTPGSIYSESNRGRLYTKTFGNAEAGWKMIQNVDSGTHTGRPTSVSRGYQFFDTTLNKPIWWNGDVWVDAMGTEIE